METVGASLAPLHILQTCLTTLKEGVDAYKLHQGIRAACCWLFLQLSWFHQSSPVLQPVVILMRRFL